MVTRPLSPLASTEGDQKSKLGAQKLEISETHMGTPCDICAGFTDGGIAFEEVIVTCSKCRIAREHIYCMRANLSHWNWDEWVCESCFKGDGMLSSKFSIKGDPLSADLAHYDGMHSASSSKSRNYSGWQAHSRRQKAVMSGKVKYISHEEVKQLYSADTKSTSPQKASVGFKTAAPKSPISRVKASSGNMIRPRRGRPPKMQSMSISEKGSPISISGSMTRPRRGRPPKMQSISKINQQASEILKHSQEERASGTHTKEHIIEEQPMDASVLYGGVESSSRKKVKEQNKVSCTPSPSRHSSLNMSSGGITSAAENNHSDGEERDLLNKLSSLHLNRLYLPALHATWKGGFIIFDADTPAQFIGGFQAQPPCKVRRKAYEFSKKMPPVLRANLLPQSHLWADPFQDECPELEDVALYFFPDDNTVSSRESYASLFEVMDTKNSVMRIYFDGVDAVELLIFTSKQLRLDLPNTDTSPKAGNFLWGIFRPKSNCQADMDDSGNTADMEVDMVGGKMVGTVDVVVSKDSSTPCTRSEPIMTAVQQLLSITKMDHSSYQAKIRALDSAIKQLLGVQSEELKDTDTSASSAMKTTHGLQQVKLEKDEDETSVETDEKRLLYPPRFPQPSPQSGAGSSDGIVGARLQL